MSVATCTPNATLSNKHVTRQLEVKWARQCVSPGHSSKVLNDITSYVVLNEHAQQSTIIALSLFTLKSIER